MTAIAAIRTNRWGPEEERLSAWLVDALGSAAVVVFHNRPEGVTPPLPVVDINDDWVRAQGLRAVADWGWRCGDYSYYALREAHPGFDHYWLVEPDIYVKGDLSEFFDRFEAVGHDALGVGLQAPAVQHMFVPGVTGRAPMQALFPVTRLSGPAIDYLLAERRAYSAGPMRDRRYTNDEMFVFSWIASHPVLTAAALEQFAPEWFAGCHFTTNPDIILDAVLAPDSPAIGLFHPVRAADSYAREVGRRIGESHRLRRIVSPSLGFLGDTEAEIIGRAVADALKRLFAEHAAGGGSVAVERGGRDE